jgi:hypothetical protein
MLNHINEFLTKWEGLWLFVVLISGLCVELHSNYVLRKEYEYDEAKDLAKKKRTRTSKKTVTNKDGSTTVEESSEAIEPMTNEK